MRRSTTKKRSSTSKKPATRRRRRVSGINQGMIMDVVALVGGGILAREANNIIQTTFPGKVSPTIVGAGQIVLGLMLPKFIKNSMAANIGRGMAVMGGTQLAVSMGVISGTGNRVLHHISGKGNLSAVAGRGNLSAIAGGNMMVAGVNSALSTTNNTVKRQFPNYS